MSDNTKTANAAPATSPSPKKPGFWSRVGAAVFEVVGSILYQGPR